MTTNNSLCEHALLLTTDENLTEQYCIVNHRVSTLLLTFQISKVSGSI